MRAVDKANFRAHAESGANASADRLGKINDQLTEKREALSEAFRNFGEAQKELGNYQAKTQARTSLAMSAAVVPGVGLAGYAQSGKEERK